MRLILLASALLVAAPLASTSIAPAVAQTTSGPQSDRPSDGSGGHECESKKKEQVTS